MWWWGGAGLGNVEGFGLVRELAAAVGGEVAGTRPPVLLHWVDEDRLIGQTGKSVRANLLFSIGTSGAVQYTAGITESKTIVAVNRDANAPIFQVADLGIVADAKTFLPMLTARAKQVVMRKLADALSDGQTAPGDQGSFGAKIGKIRKSGDWTLESLAKATGQTPEFLTLVESDKVSPPVSFLLRLAGALGVDPGTFLSREEQTAIRDQRAQAFIKRTKSYSYETLTPGCRGKPSSSVHGDHRKPSRPQAGGIPARRGGVYLCDGRGPGICPGGKTARAQKGGKHPFQFGHSPQTEKPLQRTDPAAW